MYEMLSKNFKRDANFQNIYFMPGTGRFDHYDRLEVSAYDQVEKNIC